MEEGLWRKGDWMQRKWFGISALGNVYQFAIIIIKFFLTSSRELFVYIGILYICKIYTYVYMYVACQKLAY